MDWSNLSRLAPEVGVLAIVGYFAIRGIGIFKDIVDKIDAEHHDALGKLSKSMDRVAASQDRVAAVTTLNTKAIKAADQYLRERNGRDGEIHGEQIKTLRQQSENMRIMNENFAIMSTDSKNTSKKLVDFMETLSSKVGTQTVKEQTVKHQTIETKENG